MRVKSIIVITFMVILPLIRIYGQGHALPDSCENTEKPKSVIERLQDFALRDNLLSKLVRSFLVINSSTTGGTCDTTVVSDKKFVTFRNAYITNIDVVVLDPFGYSVDEQIVRPVNWMQKIGNRVHYPTRGWIIRNKLLFQKGDTLDEFKISESERLLRASPYIHDARILVTPVSKGSDSVNVMVVVQDIYNLGVGAAADPAKPSGNLSLTDINFLGLGQRLSHKVWYDPAYSSRWKYSGQFFVSEIGTTYISSELHYITENFNRRLGISFTRPFYSATVHWAGGLALETAREYYNLAEGDSLSIAGYHKVSRYDMWFGHAFNLGPEGSNYQKKTQFITSLRILNTSYDWSYTPRLPLLVQTFQDETFLLGSIAFSHREYFQDKYIFGFGRTEDIPLGYLLAFTGGYDQLSQYHRFYNGLKASFARNNSSLGYLYLAIEAGGFLKHTVIEQGVFSPQMLYFTNLLRLGKKWQIRQYLWNRLTIGINRRPGELIDVNRDNGLRALSLPVRGTKKWVSNYELDLFTPFSPLGFSLVPVLFVDFGLIANDHEPLFGSRLLQGYGLGLRMKNEHLVFTTFQVSIHYFPNVSDIGGHEFNFQNVSHTYYRFQDFQFSEPNTVGF